ncbi:ankyrin repeat-containing domain protein [Chaetomium sp. MPI-SDFR-AT-0129]|nr:ankyrin repeat-containing domain protein [Chaetomium sp. MPI-SDFR-AT-0129]
MGSIVEPRSHNDYTIGWVCALPKEQAAAVAMLDKEHDDVRKPPGDPNSYTLGSVGKHNIVIACLPKGQPGTNPAATVATWMASTFPRIKFGLMVGIGGGVSRKVRLSDVVVSTSVIQWDMGKAKEGGSFERTGALNNPPTALLTALSKLESKHRRFGSKITKYLAAMGEKCPEMVREYLRSDSLEDVLFKASYAHVKASVADDDEEEDEEEEESCRRCDKTMAVERKLRDSPNPRVHYGLVASGNQVIKDGVFREKLKKDLGGHVLCVEMEAAGLMNNFPCVVIRGICDYADSHKNDAWQEHAAATAAAVAKELLQQVSADDVEREPAVKDLMNQDAPTRVTGLHLAAYFGVDRAVPDLLYRYGRDPEDSHGRTPLSWAAENGHEAVVRRLLHLDADRQREDDAGLTPLDWAKKGDHQAVMKLLVSEDTGSLPPSVDDEKALPVAPDPSQASTGETTVRLLIDKDVGTNLVDSEGQTALVQQAPRGSDAAVRLLLHCQGANRTPRQTPLLWAAAEGHLTVVRQLLETGAEVGLTDDRGRTLLSLAAGNGHGEIAKLLLEQGAQAESADDQGRTPLSWAAANGYEAVVRMLLDKGAKADSVDEEGWTPLLRAAASKHDATVQLLIAGGANPDLARLMLPTLQVLEAERRPQPQTAEDESTLQSEAAEDESTPQSQTAEDESTLQLWAAENGYEAALKSLLDIRGSIDSTDEKVGAMLACAIEKGNIDAVRILLDKGASTNLVLTEGSPPPPPAAVNGPTHPPGAY